MKRICIIIIFYFVLMFSSGPNVFGTKKDISKIKKYYSMSLTELMNVKIDTAGRTSQKISDIPARIKNLA